MHVYIRVLFCSMDEEGQRRIKVVFLGDRAVGKSSIINRFITNQFDQDLQPTVGVDFMGKNILFKDQNYRIELWDTAGQEKYRSLVRGYLRGADACIFVYDCTSISSYVSIPEWLGMFDSVSSPKAYRIIVGNKNDCQFDAATLEKTKQALKFDNAGLKDLPEFMTSAKLGINIEQIFEDILLHFTSRKVEREPMAHMLKDAQQWAKSSCCK